MIEELLRLLSEYYNPLRIEVECVRRMDSFSYEFRFVARRSGKRHMMIITDSFVRDSNALGLFIYVKRNIDFVFKLTIDNIELIKALRVFSAQNDILFSCSADYSSMKLMLHFMSARGDTVIPVTRLELAELSERRIYELVLEMIQVRHII